MRSKIDKLVAEARALASNTNFRRVARQLKAAESAPGVFDLPAAAAPALVGHALLIAEMEASVPGPAGSPRPRVTVGSNLVWAAPDVDLGRAAPVADSKANDDDRPAVGH